MKRKKFTGYQQTLFNKYEIEETYIENRNQTDVLIELLEKIDKHENLDELTLLKRIKNAFRGSKVYKQIVCCVSIAAVMFVLQGHASMVNAEARFTPEPVTPAMLMQAEQNNKVVIDEESYLGEKSVQTNNSAPITSINFTVANSKAEIESNPQNSIVLDADSDVPVAKNQNMKVLNVIDSSIPDWQIIRDSISQGEVLIIDNEQTSLKEILEKAEAMGTINTLNIISHGESGILRFGNKIISVENLEKESAYWNSLGKQLSQNGDIQLFGCNIAEGEKGKAFIGKLAEITGADIAASINRTGNPELSGDWILEGVVGDIESQLPFIKEKISEFKHLLPLPTGIQVIDTNNTTFDDTGDTATHKSGWFIVSGESDGAQKNTDISGTVISIDANGPQTKFIVSEDANNLTSFELEDIALNNSWPYSLYTTLTITDTNGNTVDLNGISVGTLTKNGFAEWDTKVQDKSIKSFSISWNSSIEDENLKLNSFAVDNMVAPVTQNPPTASAVTVSGTAKVGETLTGNYTYADSESDVEGTSTFKWYRATDNSGTGKTEIAGANAKTYTLQAEDLGKYISFEVTPVATTGTATGTAELSPYTTEVLAASVAQTPPTASAVTVSGTAKVGETLTGNYTYADAESDVEGTSTFKWYRATDNSGTGKTEIAGANAKTYTLQSADLGKHISFEVTPVAATGTTTGTAELSPYTTAVVAATSGGSGGSGGGGGATAPTTPTAPKISESGVIVIVNGEKQIAGTEYVTEQQGIKQVEVKVDTKVINQKIDAIINQPVVAGRENIVEVPILTSGANRILTSLNGDSIKKMDENDFKLSLVSQNISYTIPAKEINIDELAKTLNMDKSELQNLEIQISMDKVTDAVFKEIASNAEKSNYQLVLKPVEFTITAKKVSGEGSSKSVTISKFNQYVQREFEIPEGIDPTKITTGIVYNEDGTFSHIPTTVFVRDGKYYARLNSLTNSKYSVIWNPIEVKSVEKHWAKTPVNDMASRLIIKDIDSFEPNKAITRGDFAEYITKAIGIYRTNSVKSKPFSDIELSNSLADAIAIASEYGIINGYPDGTFRPNETITREEAMSMYAKAMEITQLDNIDKARISKYKDKGSVSKWAYSAVQSTVGSGVFNGRTADKIEPKGIFTYAEAATAIRNLLVKTELINK